MKCWRKLIDVKSIGSANRKPTYSQNTCEGHMRLGFTSASTEQSIHGSATASRTTCNRCWQQALTLAFCCGAEWTVHTLLCQPWCMQHSCESYTSRLQCRSLATMISPSAQVLQRRNCTERLLGDLGFTQPWQLNLNGIVCGWGYISKLRLLM